MKFKKAKIRQVFGRQLKAKDLYNRQVFWQFISEWFGTYEDIGKMSDKLFDVTFEQIKSAKDLEHDPDFIQWMESGSTMSPPGGEDGGHFMQRVCMEFETFVERMMRTGETSAVLMVHGGTIMSILSAYGLPRAPFYDWMVEPGHGYSLRITPGLWMRSMVAEVYDTIPPREQQQNREHTVIDYAREAANRAFGDKEETES